MAGFYMRTVGQLEAAHLAIDYLDIVDLALEAKFAAEFFDFGTHQLDRLDQTKSADVRLTDVHDFRRRIGFDKLGQNLAAIMLGIFKLRPQFAVGECTCTAFAKLHIRFWKGKEEQTSERQ